MDSSSNPGGELIAYAGFYNLSREGVQHVVQGNHELLLCDAGVPYPADPAEVPDAEARIPGVHHEVFLPRMREGLADGRFGLVLPDDYMPLEAVLNEALSVQNSERGNMFSSGIFREVGHQLLRLYYADKAVPAHLTLDGVIVSRHEYGVYFLPPITVTKQLGPGSLIGLGVELLNSCVSISHNEVQKNRTFQSFQGYFQALSEGLDV